MGSIDNRREAEGREGSNVEDGEPTRKEYPFANYCLTYPCFLFPSFKKGG